MQDVDRINYNAFKDDSIQIEEKKNQGLKISNKKSMFDQEKAKVSQSDFEEAVSEFKQKDNDIRNKIADLSIKYKSFFNDKTLKKNQSVIKRELEQGTIRELSEIATQLNMDQSKPEGIGSVGLATLLMQVVLVQRDTINDLAYQVAKLKEFVLETKESSKSSDE